LQSGHITPITLQSYSFSSRIAAYKQIIENHLCLFNGRRKKKHSKQAAKYKENGYLCML